MNLRKKYQLYAESSDAETRNNTLRAYDNLDAHLGAHNRGYQDLSLPASRKSNQPDSAKLHDLSVTKHRRTSSDTSKDKKAGAYVHVKGKRKAPEPPKNKVNPRTLSPKSSLGRKKRPAPLPPILTPDEAAASTSLLEDKEIKALIEGTSRPLSQNYSTSSIPVDMERKAYVSPYLKIREDRKLTDEQKRTLLEQVSKNTRKKDELAESPQATKRLTPDVFTIERGQLVYQGNESPKLAPKEEKPVKAPSSPISPRPWFKRNSSNGHKEPNQPMLRTLEKRKSKNEDKDLPELGYSRNSFFGSASRFNIFARMGEDSKKKERDTEKRKSQIGMPNISELDREAAEIIQKSHEMNKSSKALNPSELLLLRSQINHLKDAANEDEDRPRSAKDLITKFEADSSHVNRITLNTSYIGRREFFGESFSCSFDKPEVAKPKIVENKEMPASKSKLPQLVKETNGLRRNNDLMGLWMCPYCTLENPNWKIICEACEKIKPYEKRFNVNGELAKTKSDSTRDSAEKGNVWEKKTESVMKYFSPPVANGLSKSASETAVAKSLKRKSPSPSRIAGSPQMNQRRNLFKSASEQQKSEIDVIEEEAVEKSDAKVNQNEVIVETTSTVYSSIADAKRSDADKYLKKTTPDFNEVRNARLAKFNLLPNFKKNQFDDVNSYGINSNKKQSPEKKFPDKLDFSDPIALELEKERLREKIRAMNAKALAEKYPILKKLPEIRENEKPTQPSVPQADPSKLGAIRKTFKNPFETRRGSDEKILNQICEELDLNKPDKVSTPVQTKEDVKKEANKSEDVVATVVDFVKHGKGEDEHEDLTKKQREEVEEIYDRLTSKDGIETFKATLRRKSINKTNTLAINKILRNLENAIVEGKFDEAAQLATDLAKMKVSLSVTRQRDRPKSEIEPSMKNVR